MPRNQKLTKVIAGRTIKVATTEAGGALVLFDDQSSMKIKTAGASAVSPGVKIKSVMRPGPSSKSNSKTVRARHSAWEIRAHPLRSETNHAVELPIRPAGSLFFKTAHGNYRDLAAVDPVDAGCQEYYATLPSTLICETRSTRVLERRFSADRFRVRRATVLLVCITLPR
jgi:hypothetical protein